MKTVMYTKAALRSLQAHSNRAKQIRALTGSAAKRLRVAGYRVLFTETETTITVLDVGPRGEIYQ